MRRRLFWKVYLTVLACLLAAVVAVVVVGRLVSEGGAPWTARQARAVEALVPAVDDPPGAMETAVDRLASALDADLTILSPNGMTVSHAGPALAPGRRVHAVALDDGRTALVRFRGWPAGGGARAYILPLVAAVIGLVAYPIVRRITRRLERVRDAMEQWGDGSLSARVVVGGQDEVAAVAAAFNGAAARIERLVAAHRSLLANASHELRSPLARLRVAVELAGQDLSPEARREAAESLGELDELVGEILLASRLSHDRSIGRREPVDLLALCAEEAARVSADAHGEAGLVEADPRLLRRLVRNLVENASRHGAPPIELEVTRAGPATLALTVRDHGPGIPHEERTRVFEPFYRPAGRSEAAGSWGLGLSLVRQIAEAHGGSVRCDPTAGGGATFVIQLPQTFAQS